MARLAKSKTLGAKPKAKGLPSKAKLSAVKEITAKAEPKRKAAPVVQAEPAKKVSQKLIETIEKRKQEQAKAGNPNRFGKPAGRRGRRPKNVHYTPQHTDDDNYTNEAEFEGLEYDTGIRVKSKGEDGGFGVDRFEEFDEELNFDW
jgi:hypothetical protein